MVSLSGSASTTSHIFLHSLDPRTGGFRRAAGADGLGPARRTYGLVIRCGMAFDTHAAVKTLTDRQTCYAGRVVSRGPHDAGREPASTPRARG